MSRIQIFDPSKICVHNRQETSDDMMAGGSFVATQEKMDKEFAIFLDLQLNTNTASEKQILSDKEIAQSLDRELNQTHDLSHDLELARLLDQQPNISAVASTKEDALNYSPSAEIPDLSRDWEFAKSMDIQFNVSVDTSRADVSEASAEEDVLDYPPSAEIPELSRDWEFTKSVDRQFNVSIDTSRAESSAEEDVLKFPPSAEIPDLSRDWEFAKSVDRQYKIFDKICNIDKEIAQSLDRELNQTHDLSHDLELARLLDQQPNISAVASAQEDVLDFPPSAEIPDLSHDWEFAKSVDRQFNS